VFKDNAGVVRFDDQYNVVFKVETHNHPSALEPYGGANTGIGGVIRDPMGTGMGAKPVCNTDVFCFAPPDTPSQSLPPGVLHPRRVMKGVVSGVRDYGNRMGIPTVNGALYFDPRYLGNPLVYCGNVGLLPVDQVAQAAALGRLDRGHRRSDGPRRDSRRDVQFGGTDQRERNRLGRRRADRQRHHRKDGLGRAAAGARAGLVQRRDRLRRRRLRERRRRDGRRDRRRGVAGTRAAEVRGLTYTEIWISEAQERMVLSVSPQHWEELATLCRSEGVEATIIGRFEPTGRLELKYDGTTVGQLTMEFLHGGRPPVVREAVYQPLPVQALAREGEGGSSEFSRIQLRGDENPVEGDELDHSATVKMILGSLNVASKEWVIRQYDHEVQGGSAIKPLVGATNDGPGDAAVLRPVLSSNRGLVIACGMNPRYGDLDPYRMAASAIDEAVRNCVAVGADPQRIAILDNFCWGYTDRPETLGSLVRAALACRDLAVALGTPFISGKDSLNNEFSYEDSDGRRQTISIPPSLLISAMGQVDDVRHCVTMDLKEPGNLIYLIGT
jgi:phosphoribosylformylglycinamidine synthase subunit PurSL